jgi:hypothetical protein
MKLSNKYVLKAMAIMVMPLLPVIFSFQEPDNNDEYAVKSMFICNFTKYIDWPEKGQGEYFVIAVFGKSEITRNLIQISMNKKVNNKILVVRTITSASEADDCQVIFIPKSNNAVLPETIERLGSRGKLIIAEDRDMALKGASINLVTVDGKIKIELSDSAVRRDGLKIANQLASLAIHVR